MDRMRCGMVLLLISWLSAGGAIADDRTADQLVKVPNYKLIGVKEIIYEGILHEEVFNREGREYRCKLDRQQWKAAMDQIARSFPKLALTSAPPGPGSGALLQSLREKYSKPLAEQSAAELEKAKRDAAEAIKPRLRFGVTSAEAGDICIARVEAHVSALGDIEGSATFPSTKQAALIISGEMWSGTAWVRRASKDITAAVIDVTSDLMKDLLAEWEAAASCLGPKDLICR